MAFSWVAGRAEVSCAVRSAFDCGPAVRAGLLEAALGAGARPEVVVLLRQLPDRRFGSVREVWLRCLLCLLRPRCLLALYVQVPRRLPAEGGPGYRWRSG